MRNVIRLAAMKKASTGVLAFALAAVVVCVAILNQPVLTPSIDGYMISELNGEWKLAVDEDWDSPECKPPKEEDVRVDPPSDEVGLLLPDEPMASTPDEEEPEEDSDVT